MIVDFWFWTAVRSKESQLMQVVGVTAKPLEVETELFKLHTLM